MICHFERSRRRSRETSRISDLSKRCLDFARHDTPVEWWTLIDTAASNPVHFARRACKPFLAALSRAETFESICRNTKLIHGQKITAHALSRIRPGEDHFFLQGRPRSPRDSPPNLRARVATCLPESARQRRRN